MGAGRCGGAGRTPVSAGQRLRFSGPADVVPTTLRRGSRTGKRPRPSPLICAGKPPAITDLRNPARRPGYARRQRPGRQPLQPAAAQARKIVLHEHEALQHEHRKRSLDPRFQEDQWAHLPMIERSDAWFTLATAECRTAASRHRRNNAWLHLRIAGLNLRGLLNLGLRHLGTGVNRPPPRAGTSNTSRSDNRGPQRPSRTSIARRHRRDPTNSADSSADRRQQVPLLQRGGFP
jgi:hypothetical protein